MKKITLLFTLLCVNALNGMEDMKGISIVELIERDHLRCNKEEWCYGFCVCYDMQTLMLFIDDRVEKSKDIKSTADIIKKCLPHRDNSLLTIRRLGSNKETALQEIIQRANNPKIRKYDTHYFIDVLCQAAGENLIDFLCAQDTQGQTALHIAVQNANTDIVEKLIYIAHDKALKLISVEDRQWITPLSHAQLIVTLLSTYLQHKASETQTEILQEIFKKPLTLDSLNQMKLIVKLLESANKTT